jgi:lysyl-tRNA synthetase class 2
LNAGDWRPSASLAVLRRRAALLVTVRSFFRDRDVLEVETPVALGATVTDVHVQSLELAGPTPRFLQTSPEYPMKRLLAAGSGDIYQICHVFRADEISRLHNPEFTMIEWYRLGMDFEGLMAETAALAQAVLAADGNEPAPVESLSYSQAFERELGCHPLDARTQDLAALAASHGLAASTAATATHDELLDFLVATRIGPALGRGRLTCLHHFPASQAALAQLDTADPRCAQRFELYAEGVELANGYVELANPAEQRRRFEADLVERRRRGLAQPAIDARLLAALADGLPACAGVAMGFDRLVMLAVKATSIEEVLAFPWERA